MQTATHITATILGCGSSGGVPRVGNIWGHCDPENPKNRRRRCSVLIKAWTDNPAECTQVLIDTGCDVREQLLDANVALLDAVLYTHEHADHTHGIDDLRMLALVTRKRVEVYADPACMERLKTSFGYCFEAPEGSGYPPILNGNVLTAGKEITIEGAGGAVTILPFEQEHGSITSLGFRIGKFAYSCDLSGFAPESIKAVSGLDMWVIDALRYKPHPSHLSLQETLDWIARMQPGKAVLTNMHTDLDYVRLIQETPTNVQPAFDGMVIDVITGEVVNA